MRKYLEFLADDEEFNSEIFVPNIKRLYILIMVPLPSSVIRCYIHKYVEKKHVEKKKGSTDQKREEIAADQKKEEIRLKGIWLESYIIITTVILALWVGAYGCKSAGWYWWVTVPVMVVGFFRLWEILAQSLQIMLGRTKVDAPTTMTTLGFYVVQTVAIFTLCAEILGPCAYKDGFGQHPTRWWHFLYLTWNNMATLGNSYGAVSLWSQIFAAAANITTILLLSVLLGFAVGKLNPPYANKEGMA